jgi:outer membrane protein TolC
VKRRMKAERLGAAGPGRAERGLSVQQTCGASPERVPKARRNKARSAAKRSPGLARPGGQIPNPGGVTEALKDGLLHGAGLNGHRSAGRYGDLLFLGHVSRSSAGASLRALGPPHLRCFQTGTLNRYRAEARRSESFRSSFQLALRSVLAAALLVSGAASANAISLDAALAKTLEKNPVIFEAKIALEQAAGRRLVLRSNGLPNARLQGLVGVQGGKRAREQDAQPFGLVRGFFTQPLFNAAVPASRRRGDVEVLLARQRLNVAIVEQLHTTRIAFYTALLNDSLRELGEAQRQRLAENVSTQAERYQAGQSDRGAMASARLLEQELNPRIEEVRRGYQGALLTLATCMGEDVGGAASATRPDGELTFAAVGHDLRAETTAALRRRPDLNLARLLIRAAEEDQRIIEAAYYPALDATLAGTYIPVTVRQANGGSPNSSNDIISSEASAGVAYTWRVVDNGKVGGRVARARAVREMNEISLRQLEANVSLELRRIDNNLHAAEQRWKSLSAAVASAEQNVNVVQRTLAEGLSSQLEFRTAESSFLETKSALLSTMYQQSVAQAEWDRATGRYFQFSEDTAGNSH